MVEVVRNTGMAGGIPVGTTLRATRTSGDRGSQRRDRGRTGLTRASRARSERCRRCAGERWLIRDDGPAICRICVMAWSWLASAVTGGETIPEPHITTMRHAEHVRPETGCPLCRPVLTHKRLGRLDERSGSF